MNRYDLPYYDNILCSRMAFIEPFCTEWEVVTLNHLIELKDCLTNEWVNFQRAIFDDIRNGFCSSYCVMSIFKTLRKFSKWFYNKREAFWNAMEHNARHIVEKARIAKEIADFIEIMWIPLMWDKYDELKKESEKLPETLTCDEHKRNRSLSKEEEKREIALRTLFSLIKGSSTDEKHRKSEILRRVLTGMKGKTVATYLQAALELNWLSEIPEFSIMKMFWGVEGSQGAISKMFSIAGGSLINEETLKNAKDELVSKLT
ncbi:hypothetical protein [Paramuribaculum intestinale]|uniref:hypothetical protein n=1 Tax=Paramuribaculum intestinale TaxID=2094151 RepID=UPI00260C54C4|nr:hypothetical protein [Paramuribaculum intestinale]